MAQSAGTGRATLKAAWERDGFFTLGAFLAALVPRLWVALAITREPVWDGHYYDFGAKRIAMGLGYSEDVLISGVPVWKPWCHYPVGYSGFLGGLYRVFGSGPWVAPVANALVGALTVAVVHRLALPWLGRSRARLAALLCLFHPGLVLYTGLVMTEGLSSFLLLLVAHLALLPRRKELAGLVSGVALGLGALVRPTALLAGPLLPWVFRGARRARWLATGIAALACIAVIAPWTLRNCRVMDGCALISTNGGWNLAIGALTDTGRFRTLTAKDGCPVVTGQVQQDRCWAQVGLRIIQSDVPAWLRLIPKKLAHTYNHESFAVAYLAEANPRAFGSDRGESLRTTTTVFHHLLMLFASLAGVALLLPAKQTWRALWRTPLETLRALRPRRLVQPLLFLGAGAWVLHALGQAEPPLYWLIVVSPLLLWVRLPDGPALDGIGRYLGGLVLTTTLTHALFFGEDRYHITISPVLCILAAAALRRPASAPGAAPAAR